MKLGDRAKDKVSDFEGILVSRTTFLTGCDRWEIQPKVDKDGKLPDPRYFDVHCIKVLKSGAVSIPKLVEVPAAG